jgi:hypothetical protein
MVRLNGFAIAALAIGLSGCTALEQRETQAWLALHAVDTAQTYRIAQDARCFNEADGITRELIGAHPSTGQVLAWSVGSAAVHVGVTELLLRNDHPKLAKAWQYVRIGVTASAIENNHSIGIRIGSPNEPPPGSCDQRVEDVVNPIIEIP